MLYIKVIVTANAKKEKFFQKNEDHFEISVKEKAENNLANKKVREILALFYKVSLGKVRIANGHHHSHKLLVVDVE